MKNLANIVDNFSGKKIAVIGDVMLDHFLYGDIKRISPEAPAPVVLLKKESFIPGGSANAAANIRALGGQVFLMGVIGNDEASKIIKTALKKMGVTTDGLVMDLSRPTIQKMRIIAGDKHIVRVDREEIKSINASLQVKVLKMLASRIKNLDMVVISDYAKGMMSKSLVKNIIKLAKKHNKMVIADTKPSQMMHYKNVFLLKPNAKEARQMANEQNLKKAGAVIQKKLQCNVVITAGVDGMMLFENDSVVHFSTKAKKVFDVVGAGDTVLSALALALAAGATLNQACVIANHAAGIVVGKIGTATVSLKELRRSL